MSMTENLCPRWHGWVVEPGNKIYGQSIELEQSVLWEM